MTDALPPLPKRLIQLLFSPGALFESLSARPAWGGALVLGAVIGATGALLAPTELYEATVREQMMAADRPVPNDLSGIATVARLAGAIAALVVGPLITAAMAGIVAFLFLFALGDEGSYRQHLAVVAHAFLVASLSTVLLVPLKIGAGDLQLRLSVRTFLPFLEDGWIASALSWLDLFALWAWVLVALGVSKIDRERSWGSASAIIVGLVILLTFTIAGVGALT